MRPAALALTLTILPLALHAAAQQIPAGEAEFTAFVAGQLRQQAALAGQAVTIKGPLTLKVGELQANLDRIYHFCRADAGSCKDEIDRYTQGLAQVLKDMNAPLRKEAVRLAVRPSSYARQAAPGKAIRTWPLPAIS